MSRDYWLTVFTVETWKEFRHRGGDTAGFGERRWPSVRKIRPGDYLLCYLMRVSKFIGILEVVGEPFFDRREIWSSGVFPSRVPVHTILEVELEQGIPVLELRDRLSILRNLDNPKWWSGYFQTSPSRWIADDGETVIRALKDVIDRSSEGS